MARFNSHINHFLSGELSPKVNGRTDLEVYRNGCSELLNMYPRSQGGATRRMGTCLVQDRIITDLGGSLYWRGFATEGRLIPFVFSETEYAVVVIQVGTRLRNPSSIPDNNCIGIWDAVNNEWADIEVAFATSYYSDITYDTTGPWSSQDDLDAVHYSQTGDTLVLTSAKHPPFYITRDADGTFVVRDVFSVQAAVPSQRKGYGGSNTDIQYKLSPSSVPTAAYYNVPYKAFQHSGVSVTPSATTGTINLTASSGVWTTAWIGCILRMTKSGTTGFVLVTGYTSTTVLTGTVLKTLGGATAHPSTDVEQMAWGPPTSDNWPRRCVFFEQRLYFAGTYNDPDTLWASQTGDVAEMMIVRPADDANFSSLSNDRPYSITLAAQKIDDISWLAGGRRSLFIGTLGAEYLGYSETDQALGPLNPNFKIETQVGGLGRQAVFSEGSLFYVNATKDRLQEMLLDQEAAVYKNINTNKFADHIFKKGLTWRGPPVNFPEIVCIQKQSAPQEIIWCLDSNRILHGLARDKEVGLNGWFTCEFSGGLLDTYGAEGTGYLELLSFCVTPSQNGGNDTVWLLVRKIGGTEGVRLLKMANDFILPELDMSVGVTTSNIFDPSIYPLFTDRSVLAYNYTQDVTTDRPFFACYNSSINADWGTGTLTGTGTGSPSVSGGFLNLTGGGTKYVSYNSDNFTNFNANSFSISLSYKPNFSGYPASNQHLLAIAKSNADDDNLISIVHTTTGAIQCIMKDSTGATTRTLSGFLPQDSVYEIYHIRVLAESSRAQLFVNGLMLDDDSTSITRDTSIGRFVVGTSYNAAHTADFSIGYVLFSPSGVNETFGQGNTLMRPVFNNDIIDGLDDYEGKTVTVMADGGYAGEYVVTNGQITLNQEGYQWAIVGFKYTSRLKTMDLEAGSILGSSQGQVGRIDEVTLRFERTVGAKYGPSTSKLYELDFRGDDLSEGTIPLYTGDKRVLFPQSYERNKYIVVQTQYPLPLTITSLVARGVTYD